MLQEPCNPNCGLEGRPLPAWHCPGNETPLAFKYDTQEWRSCSSGHGSTGKNVASSLRCVAVVVGEMLQVLPGASVLDWGSGCGWMLTWLHTLFGAHGYAIDASSSAVAWARRFSCSTCLWSSLDLRWLPDLAFDHIISYGALYHLSPLSKLCALVRQLLRKLRPGGRAWFGGNQPWGITWATSFGEQQWLRCLQRKWVPHSASFSINFVHDFALFRADTVDFGKLRGDFLLHSPTFSVFVTRLA